MNKMLNFLQTPKLASAVCIVFVLVGLLLNYSANSLQTHIQTKCPGKADSVMYASRLGFIGTCVGVAALTVLAYLLLVAKDGASKQYPTSVLATCMLAVFVLFISGYTVYLVDCINKDCSEGDDVSTTSTLVMIAGVIGIIASVGALGAVAYSSKKEGNQLKDSFKQRFGSESDSDL